MSKIYPIFILLTLMLLCVGSSAQAEWKDAELEWKLKRDRKGIQVFLSKVPDSKFRAILSVMQVEATPKQLAALIMNTDNCPKLATMCKSAKIIERVSSSESYVYSINSAPFPVRDRDAVSHVKWSYDSASGKISMHGKAAPNKLPKTKGLIRIQYASSEWHFTPMSEGTTLVENYAHIDPNGRIPAWLINLLMVDSPYKVFKNIRELVNNGQYSDIDFISRDGSDNEELER